MAVWPVLPFRPWTAVVVLLFWFLVVLLFWFLVVGCWRRPFWVGAADARPPDGLGILLNRQRKHYPAGQGQVYSLKSRGVACSENFHVATAKQFCQWMNFLLIVNEHREYIRKGHHEESCPTRKSLCQMHFWSSTYGGWPFACWAG